LFVRGSRDTVVTNVVQQTTAILIFLVVPNVLPVTAFAEVTFVNVLLSFGILADCGMSFVYSRKMPSVYATGNETEIRKWNSSTFWTTIPGNTAFAVAVAAVYFLKYGNAATALLLISIPPLTAIVSFSIARLTVRADFSIYRTVNTFQAIARLVVIPLAYYLGLLGWFVAQVVTACATLLRIQRPIIQPRAAFDIGLVRAHLLEGALLVATTFLWFQLLYSGRLFASMYYPDDVIAAYGVFSSGYQVVASLVIAAFLPVTVQALKLCGDREKEAAQFIFRMIYLSVPVVFLLGVLTAEIAPYFFARFFPKYQVDPHVPRALIYSLFSFPVLVTLGNLFMGRRKNLHYLAILILSLGTNWAVMGALMPSLGHRAAAVAQLVSVSLCALLMVLVSFYVFRDLIDGKAYKFLMIYGQLGLLISLYLAVRMLWA
jgi:O-antigen/teichoic acid export membrane protein